MLLTPRRTRPTPDELARQALTKNPDAILQAARENDRARMAAAETSPVAGGVRVGPRPVEEMPVAAPRPRGVIKISPRINPTPPVGSSAPLDPISMTSPAPTVTSPSAPTVPPTYDPPPPGSVEEAQAQVDEAAGRVVKDKNGTLMSILKMALQGAGQQFQGGRTARNWQELAGGIGGGVAGAITGAVKNDSDEQMQKEIDITARQGELERRTKNEANRANIRYKNATAEKVENYDEIEGRKADERAKTARAAELNRARNAVLANLRLFKGSKLDASVPAHAALLQRAAEVGVVIDPESWNSAKENVALVELVDPDNPTQKRRVAFNRATGDIEDIGQSGYVQPVGDDGMTEAQRRGDADRDASRRTTQARFERAFGLQNERYDSAEAQRVFNTKTKGSFEKLRSIKTQIEKYQTAAAKAEMRPETARARIVELETEAARVSDEIEAARSEALSPSSGPRPAVGGRQFTEADVRARARAARRDPEAAVKAARERGLIRE